MRSAAVFVTLVVVGVVGVGVVLGAGGCQSLGLGHRGGGGAGGGGAGEGAGFAGDQPWSHVAPPPGPPVDFLSTDRCAIDVHEDNYYGFAVGHPAGWKIDYSTGTLIVQKDDTGMVGAMIFPARLRRTDVTPEYVASMFAAAIGARVRAIGGSFDLVDKITDGRVATAYVDATINGTHMRGPLQVIASPGFMTLKVYWAPDAEMREAEPALRQVMSCFKRKTVITQKAPVAPRGGPTTKLGGRAPSAPSAPVMQPTQAFRDRYFAMQLPVGMTVANENEHGIDLVTKDRTMAMGFGYVLNPMTRADVYAQQTLQQYYAGAQVLWQGWLPAPQGWLAAQIEFVQTLQNGYQIHGVLRVTQGQGVLLSFGWQTGTALWDKFHATLEAAANSIQIQPAAVAQVQAGIRAQLATYPPVHSSVSSSSSSSGSSWDAWNKSVSDRWESEDRRNQGFDDAILGQDHTRSPSSGETYVVPNNAWSETGPQGAGYYRQLPGGGVERLEVQGTDYQ